MKKKTGGGGSDSTAYHKKKIEGSNRIVQNVKSGPTASYAAKSLVDGAKGLAKAENKKAGIPEPKKDFSHGSPYQTKQMGYDYPKTGLKLPKKK